MMLLDNKLETFMVFIRNIIHQELLYLIVHCSWIEWRHGGHDTWRHFCEVVEFS